VPITQARDSKGSTTN